MPIKLIKIYHPKLTDIHEQRLLREEKTALSFFYCSPLEIEYVLYQDKDIFFDLSNHSVEIQVCKVLSSEVLTIWSTENNNIIIENATKGHFTISPDEQLDPNDYKYYVIIKNKNTNEQTTISCHYFSIKEGPCTL